MQLDDVINRLKTRKKELVYLKDKTDSDLQSIIQEMQKDHQWLLYQEALASDQREKEKIRQIRKEVEEQQNLVKKYEQIKYKGIVKKNTPKIPVLKNTLLAFLIGGTICTIGQIILNFFTLQGIVESDAKIFTSAAMVFIGALLTGLGIYDEIGKFGGAGSMVPITGFANSIVSPALEFKREGYVYGVGAKIFTIAGPVLLYGTLLSVIIGLLFYIFM